MTRTETVVMFSVVATLVTMVCSRTVRNSAEQSAAVNSRPTTPPSVQTPAPVAPGRRRVLPLRANRNIVPLLERARRPLELDLIAQKKR